jgi:hypothetical protein
MDAFLMVIFAFVFVVPRKHSKAIWQSLPDAISIGCRDLFNSVSICQSIRE